MRKPDEIPQDLWDDMTQKQRECAVHGHTWSYDTCDNCGDRRNQNVVSMRTNIHRPSDQEYRRQVRKLGGR